MGLRLRRGTNTQRQAVTFAEGELIYVTDYVTAGVSPLWIGDGSTAGGKEVETGGTPSLTLDDLTDVVIPSPGAGENEVLAYVGGQWTNTDPASLGISGPLNSLTDVNVPAPAQNNVLAYTGSEWTSVAANSIFSGSGIVEGQEYNISINGSVIGADSSIIVDNVTQVVTANLFVGSGAGLTDINLVDLDDVFAFGAVENDVLTYDGTGWVPLPSQGIQLGQTYNINIEGDVLGSDSSIIVNASTGIITGDLIGDVTGRVFGDVTGNIVGNVDGDLKGSVFGDDSFLLLDGVNSILRCNVENSLIVTGNLAAGDIRVGGNNPNLISTINPVTTSLNITTANTNGTIISNRPFRIGGISAGYSNGSLTIFNDAASTSSINIVNNVENANSTLISIARSRGTKASPSAVQSGDTLGAFVTSGFNGSNYVLAGGIGIVSSGSPAANRIPAQVDLFTADATGTPQVRFKVDDTGTATFTGPAQLAIYANPTARDSAIPSPSAGMMIFVTDSTGSGGAPKAQVNTDNTTSGWVDLH